MFPRASTPRMNAYGDGHNTLTIRKVNSQTDWSQEGKIELRTQKPP